MAAASLGAITQMPRGLHTVRTNGLGCRRERQRGWWRAIAGGAVDSSLHRYTIVLWS